MLAGQAAMYLKKREEEKRKGKGRKQSRKDRKRVV